MYSVVMHEAQAITYLVCMQAIAKDQEKLKDPFTNVESRDYLERNVMTWKDTILSYQDEIASIDSALQGES